VKVNVADWHVYTAICMVHCRSNCSLARAVYI